MFINFWNFASKFITIEELQITVILSFISVLIILFVWIFNNLENKLN